MRAVEDVVQVGRALADPTRTRLLSCLTVRDLCVCELVHLMSLGQPAVSRHLRILKDAGLVEDVRAGKFVNYRIRKPARTTFGDSALAALVERQEADAELQDLREKALVVDRNSLKALAD